MANFNAIHGQRVRSRAGNPSPLIIGTMFYDTSSNTLKIVYNNSGTLTVVTVTPV